MRYALMKILKMLCEQLLLPFSVMFFVWLATAVGCGAHDRADVMVDRWLSLNGGLATSSTIYREYRICETTTVSAYLIRYLPKWGQTGRFR